MRTFTYSNQYKRTIQYLCLLTFFFSSMLAYGQDPLPTIVPNTNRGLPFLYALPDNGTDLFAVAPDPTSNPLPNPSITTTDRTFDGEGSGFRSSNRKIYAFDDDNDMYELDPSTGNSTLLVNNMFDGVVQGVEFYLNNVSGEEVMFLIADSSGGGNGGEKLYAFDPNNNWASYSGYPKIITGGAKKYDGIAWDPASGIFYVQTDDDVDFYTMDVTNASTSFAFSTEFELDGEGIGFAADGNLYIETEDGTRRIYSVDTSNGDLTEAAQLGGSSDVEGIMGNVGVRDDGGDIPSSYGWAAHQLPVLESTPITVYMGFRAPDAEDPFTTVNGGFGDDATGVDDEDGVELNGTELNNQILNPGQSYTLEVETHGNGKLNAWIDWNGDGDFDSNEQVANNATPSGGNVNVNITVPAGADLGITYARFRYSSQSNLSPSFSEAIDGEVEDYKISIASEPIARDCNCTPLYKDSNFSGAKLVTGSNLQVGAVYRFSDVFPTASGDPIDALVKIEEFSNGASLLEIDVTSSGLDEAFQPRINSTNDGDQSVLFSITFVEDGGNYGDEVDISFYGSPLDIDGDGVETREYAELSLPDAYFIDENTVIDISQSTSVIRGESTTIDTAPGGDVSLDPRFTYSNYWQTKSSLTYRIGKVDGDSDRYYSFNASCVDYNDPDSVLITYPVICGNVSDEGGDPLSGVDVDITGTDGSSQTVTTDGSGNYKAVAIIPEALVDVTYEIRENDPAGYISISDVDGANDNLITRTIALESTCGNDFVDGADTPDGWNFVCGDDKVVDEYGYNANCNITTVASIPTPANVYQYVVEIVYKGGNPGQTLDFTDSGGTTHSLVRSVPVGTSSNIWVYRGLIPGNTSDITYTTTSSLSCKLQSIVLYAFRNVPNASSSSGVFTSKSGVNDIQTITIDIPSFTDARNLSIVTPISELTDDGRYLLLKAEAGGISDEIFIYGPDSSLPGGSCCLAMPTLTLPAVPGNVTQVTITVDTRNNQNGQSVNGQSWVIASGVNVDGDCYGPLELVLESKTDILCFGDNTGSITVMATGGLPPYMYSLNGGTPQASPTFNNLVAGVYTVGVEDTLGNTDSISVTLTEPDPLVVQLTKMDATATGGCANGEATATPSGGVGPYTYQWSASAGNQTTQTATNLPGSAAGGITHSVVVTDANGCTTEQSVVIDCVNDCDAVISVDNVVDVLCKGDMTGSATVSASSVANPGATFTFAWNTVPPQIDAGVTSSTISNQGAGVYTVSVTIDGTLCNPVEQSVSINEPATAVNVTATSTDESGPGAGDGTATANPSGGTPPYSYLWSPGGETTQTITGLGAGDYTVTVTDANGCTAMATTTVNSIPCNLSANASSTPVSCNGGNDGTATVGVSGGIGPFTYSWSPGGQTTQSISGLTAGVYTVTVFDTTTLCTETSTTTVNEPGALSSGIAVTHVACYGDPTGSLDLTVSGGTQPYTFLWSPGGETTEDLTNLPAGTYSVLITDANGCTLTDSATVMQPQSELDLQITAQTDIVCSGLGSVTVAASGGTPPYLYSLDGGTPQASGTFSNLAAGTYSVAVLDGNGCDDSVAVTILANCTDAINDINNTFTDIPVAGNVLTNDEDEEGDNQIVTTVGTFPTTAGGSVTINADGSYVYTPPAGYVGEDTFQYSIEDDGNPQATDTATVFIEVLPIDQNTTIANADTAGTEVDTPVSGNVLVNDFDPEGDNQVVTNVGTFPTTQGGSITIAADGSFTYTPPAGFTGEDTFEYFITDDNINPAVDSAILTITVNSGPDPNRVYANDDAYHGNQGATITGNVLDNDSDPEGDNFFVDTVITPVSGPSNGTLSINADGTFSYVPTDPSFFGTDQFVYEIFDDGAPVARDQATVIITIFGLNTTDAVNDINNTFTDVAVAGNVLTNDEDDQGDNQIVTTVGTFPTTAGGSVTINADGSYVYTPPAGYSGPDTFQYSIEDDGNPQATDTATVFIEVLPINQNTTIANADTAGTEVDTPVSGNVLVNDFDPEGDNQVVTNVGTFPTTQGGSITIAADGSFTYTPPAGFTGEDTFEYFITDDNINPAVDSAILTITVNSGPDPNRVYANDDAYHGNQGATITGNVLDNDSDPEGDNFFVDTVITPVSGPSNGTLSINADGTFSYVPTDPSFFGTDQFVYEIFDDGAPVARDQATVIITLFGNNTTDAVNDINNTFVNIPVAGNVLTNDEDDQGDNQTVTTVGTFPTTAGGSVTMNADGSYIYTPPADYVGEDTFQYSITDDGNPAALDTATVFIEVLPIVPGNVTIANADIAGTEVDTPVSGNVLVNDFDPEGDNQVVTNVGTFPTTQGGSITIAADGSFTYTPPAGFTGEDTFEYFIIDDNVVPAIDSAILTITVNDGPNPNRVYANDDAYNGSQGATILGNVLDNDSDPEGDNFFVDTVITPVSGPSNGTLSINADGSFSYVPTDPTFFGTDQFVYEIFDDGAPVARDQATVIITVFGMNTTYAINDINDTLEDTPVPGNVLTNDRDDQGDNQVVTTTGTFPTAQGGSVTLNADGSYVYTPAPGFIGEDTFPYSIEDDGDPIATDDALVTIQVIRKTSKPNTTVANADTAQTLVDTPVPGNVLVNDFDPQGDNQMVTNVGTFPTTQGGSITINADGSYVYTPPAGYVGDDTFEYFISDDGTPIATDSAILTIKVYPVVRPNYTFANDDAYLTYVDTPVPGNVLDNDTDPEGDNQSVNPASPLSGPSNGSVVLNADGSFVYTPNAGFFGTDHFVYEAIDDGTPQASDKATVTIIIPPQNTTYAINDINATLLNTPVPGNVLTNDRDDEGDNQVVTTTGTFATAQGGSVTLNSDGSYIYTPPTDYIGLDTFPYSIEDDGVLVATDNALVSINVVPTTTNNSTIANADTAQTLVDTPVPGNVLVNDFDPQGDNQMVTTVGTFPTTQGGSITINADGSFVYTPPAGYVGNDTFTYGISDDGTPIATDTAVLTIKVYPIVRPNYTFANDDAYYTEPGVPVVDNVLLNDSDPEGDNQSVNTAITPISGPSNGTLVINPDGSFTYTPDPGFQGTDHYVYEVIDDGTPQASDRATVTIVVQQTAMPVIAIVKTGVFVDGNGNQCADAGEAIDYTFVVTNEGNVPLSAISVTDPLLEAPNPVVPIVFTAGDANVNNILDLTETWIYSASYAITQDDIDAGMVTNQATAQGTDPDGTVATDLSDDNSVLEDDPTVVTLCQNAAIAIVKTGVFVDGNGDQCADPGEMIDYTFEVTNQGNVSLASILVNDPLLGGPIAGPASGDTDGDTELDVTETWIYTASYAITQVDIDAGMVTNQATAEGTDPNGIVVSDLSDDNSVLEDDPTVVALCQNADIAIVKTGVFVDGNGNQCADVGEMIDYTFEVTNQGNVSLSSIVVDDPLLGGNIPGPTSGDTDGDTELDLTEVWIYNASYAVTQDDIDAGMVTNQATADGTAPNGSVVSDLSDDNSVLEDDPTVVTLCQNADIAIVKTGVFVDGNGNQCADPGEMIDYTFEVTNQGNVSLASIVVDDPLLGGNIPGPASGDTDGDTELDVTETWIYIASYAITQVDIDAGMVTNQATAEGTDPNGSVVSDLSDDNSVLEDDPTVVTLCQNASIALIKEAMLPPPSGGGCPVEGDVIDYTFTVVNTGNQTLTNVIVTDPLVTVVGGPLATLPVGATDATTFTATYVLTQADVDAGVFINQAEAEGTTPSGGTVTDLSDDEVITEDDPTVVELCQSPIIAVVKVGTVNDENGNGCADVKETISYAFTVFNLGNVTLFNVDITDPLVNVQGGPITLAPLQTDATTFTATYSITQADIDAGEVVNQAIATGTSQLGDTVSDESDESSEFDNDPTITVLCQSAVIALIKTGTPTDENGNGCVDLDETIVYDFVVTNLGNVGLTNVTVTDPMVNVVGGPINLAAGASDTETFSAIYTVTQADVDAGSVTNQATAEGTDPMGNVVSDLSDDNSNFEDDPTITVLCQDPALSVEKSGVFNDENGNGNAEVGETISYLFSVENIGNVTIYNIVLTDDLPGIIINGGPIEVLEPGEIDSTTFTGTYTVTQADIDAQQVVNQALATGMDINGNEVDDLSDDPNDPTNVDPDGDGEPDDPTVTILLVVGPEGDFEIFNGITPDGDGLNDFFNVFGIEEYPENNMKIFNRWGVLVWETDGYGGSNGMENVFTGFSNGRATVRDGEILPTGTYFYVLTFLTEDNPGELLEPAQDIRSYNGYLYINR